MRWASSIFLSYKRRDIKRIWGPIWRGMHQIIFETICPLKIIIIAMGWNTLNKNNSLIYSDIKKDELGENFFFIENSNIKR